jgi:CRAL/TRIO domain
MLKWLAPGNVRIASTKADLLPLKSMEMHVVNSSSLINTAINIVFPMLSQSIKDQVFFHYQNYPSLHEHLGREVLPQCYGGVRENVNFDELNAYLYNHENYLNKCLNYGFIACPIESVSKDKRKHTKHAKDNLVIAESI